MNDDDFMNDTLDNFTFTQTEKLFFNKTNRSTAGDTSVKGNENAIFFDDTIFLSQSQAESAENEINVFSEDIVTTFRASNDFGNVIEDVESEKVSSETLNGCLVEDFFTNTFENDEDEKNNKSDEDFFSCTPPKDGETCNNSSQKSVIEDFNSDEFFSSSFSDNESQKSSISEPLTKVNNESQNSPPLKDESYKETKVDKSCSLISEKVDVITPEKCKLSSWGLPEAVLEKYRSRNVVDMFPWQVECLSNPKVLIESGNLVYSAPTSAGKTLVAEILAMKTVFERKKKVIFILPFVSIVREKMYYFQDILGSSGIRVEGFMGSYNPPGGFQSVQVAICTIEKANSLINRLLEEGKLEEIGAVLVDEVHLLGDPSRGYLLELLLTKLRYVTARDPATKIQIVAMSATLPNLHHLAKWLNAELYTTNFRPIPLEEQAHVCGEIYDSNLKLVRKLETLPDLGTDTDNILQLCLETIKESCSVLIFCPTKAWCESLSQQISEAFCKMGRSQSELGGMLRQQLKTELIIEVLEQLKYCPVGLDDVLRKTVSFGVAFHHAGLTMDERDIIEGAFRGGAVRVLVATSTLSSGVNLPARRVIVRTPMFHGKVVNALTYRQMIGRAGRMGKDAKGESILICQKNDQKIARELMSAQLQPVESCLEGAGKLKRAILEVIASGVASTPEDVNLFTKCTLLSIEENLDENLENPIEEAVNFLKDNEFIRLQTTEDASKFVPTPLGKACLSSSMAPDEGLALFTELAKARQCFVLETELHLIYLVTPYSACNTWGNIDWMFYLDLYEKLPPSMKKVGELIGIQLAYLINATRGKIQTNTNKLYHKLLVHKRFFVALALQDLVNEKPLSEVCNKFNCNRGTLQSLQQSASSFAGMVTSFSRQLGWSSVEILISQFQDRMQFGVSRDLLDLMRLPVLNGKMARSLYNAGVETLIQLANSDVCTVENILHKVMPFESEKGREGESEFQQKQRKKVRNVWVTGKEGLTEREAAEMLVGDARNYLRIEMGLVDAKWETKAAEEQSDTELDIDIKKEASKDEITAEVTNDLDSDQSMFSDNFTLQLSEDDCSKNDLSEKPPLDASNVSEDILVSSFNEETPPCSSRKRSRQKTMNDSGTVQKKKKVMKKRRSKEEKLSQSLMNESYLTNKIEEDCEDFSKFDVVDVCADASILEVFFEELKDVKDFAMAVACSLIDERYSVIGVHNYKPRDKDTLIFKTRKVEGVAISWGSGTVYYLSLHTKLNALSLIQTFLKNAKDVTVRFFDAKEHLKVLKRCCNCNFSGKVEDAKIADWILNSEGAEKKLQKLAETYCPEVVNLTEYTGTYSDAGSISLNLHTYLDPKIRSCMEALSSWYIINEVKRRLLEESPKFLEIFDIEMKATICLSRMELAGMGVNKPILQKLADDFKKQMDVIERKCFSLAGKRFAMSSVTEVAKALGMYHGKKVSMKKEVLAKCENPIADLVLQWRKISCTLTKMIFPLIRAVENDRIYGCCVTHTATGRISMHEPNLQTVAKDFEIVNPLTKEVKVLSCRNAFTAAENCVLLSADYCQLELRILTHLSQDASLCKIMKSPGDVFKSIAAKWNKVKESMVDDQMRQNTKQICYGIIYGMGTKTLADQLNIPEEEANVFVETFRNSYPGLKDFIQKTMDNCRELGYVETVTGRRRYLPHINDNADAAAKSQAERQAVNTTVQGSAADLAKRAMIEIDAHILERFRRSDHKPKLVLHMHDELIYEVPSKYLNKMANIMKKCMENAMRLSVPFPVKLKSGASWGQMTEFKL